MEKGVEILTGLGLTGTRARVYLALCRFGILDIQTISKITGIARQDIYRLAHDLEEMGLIEHIISQPVTFRAIPLEHGISFLLEAKQKELNTLQFKTNSYLETFKPHQKKATIEKVSKQFVIVPPKKMLIHNLIKANENTHNSIDVITSWTRLKSASFMLGESLQKAWLRGVKGRVIVEKTGESLLGFVKQFWKSPNAEIRQVSFTPKSVMVIHDNKEVFVIVEPETDFAECPALWSNNSCVVNMANNYFETLWNAAKETPDDNLNICTRI